MEKLLQTLKNPFKLSMLLAVLFFVGVLVTAFMLFTLPHDLVFKGGMIAAGSATGVYAKLFIVVFITFAIGIYTINTSMKAKKEIVVFKDRKNEETSDSNAIGSADQSIDLQAFYADVKKANPKQVLQIGLNKLCQIIQAGQGALYLISIKNGKQSVEMKSAFALPLGESETIEFELGEGLVGQVAASGKAIYLDELPEGYSNAILSGLGMAAPKYIFITPILKDQKVIGVLEIATFSAMNEALRKQTNEMVAKITEQV